MRKGVNKNISPLSRIKEVCHEEVIVEPAKRLLDALFKIEQKKDYFTKGSQVSYLFPISLKNSFFVTPNAFAHSSAIALFFTFQ
jgi:hypothetical protein